MSVSVTTHFKRWLTVLAVVAASIICGRAGEPDSRLLGPLSALKEAPSYQWTMRIDVEGVPWTLPDVHGWSARKRPVRLETLFGTTAVTGLMWRGAWVFAAGPDWLPLDLLRAAESESARSVRAGAHFLAALMMPTAEARLMLTTAGEWTEESPGVFVAPARGAQAAELVYRQRNGNPSAEVRAVTGTFRMTVKDGLLAEYSFDLRAEITFSGVPKPVRRKQTVKISAVGDDVPPVPEEAEHQLRDLAAGGS